MIHSIAQRLSHRPLWQIDAMGAAIVCVMAGAWFLLGLQPQLDAKAARLVLEQELTAQNEIAGQRAALVATHERALKTIQQQIEASAIRLKPADYLNQHVSDMATAGTGTGLRIDEIKPAAPEALQRFTIVPIRLSGGGSYRSLTSFLGKLRSDFRDTGATGFQLKREGDAGDLRFEVNLVWYAAPAPAPTKK